jgi:hypothetical protein
MKHLELWKINEFFMTKAMQRTEVCILIKKKNNYIKLQHHNPGQQLCARITGPFLNQAHNRNTDSDILWANPGLRG